MDLKRRFFRLLLLVICLEGSWAWFALFQNPSMARNSVLWGYSAARLVLGAGFGLVLAGIAIITISTCANRDRSKKVLLRVENLLLKKRFLLPVVALLLFGMLTAGAYALLSETARLENAPFLAAVYGRVRPLVWWGIAACVQSLAFLVFSYQHALRDPAFARLSWRDSRAALRKVWLPVVFVVLCVAVLAPNLPRFADVPAHDSGIFLYFGSQILTGKLPYRDLWDHKPPLIFYIDALGLWLGRGSRLGVWFLELAALVTAAWLAFSCLKRYFGSWPAGIAVAGTVLNLVYLLEGGNLTEEFALPLQFAALALFTGGEKGERPWKSLLVGVTAGAAFLLKQTLVGIWIAIAGVILLESVARRDWRGAARRLLSIGAGAGAVCAGVAVFFALQHTLYDFWDIAFRYNFIYSEAGAAERLLALKEILLALLTRSPYFLIGLAAWAVGTVYLILHSQRYTWGPSAAEPFFMLLWIAVLDVPIEILMISTSTKNYAHYFMVLLPAFSILIAFLVFLVLSSRAKIFTQSAAIFFILALFFPPVGFIVEHIRPQPNLQVSRTVDYIVENTGPEDRVLVWGTQTVVNYLSGRESPTRFVHQKPLFRAGYASTALSAEFLEGITTTPPKLIINTWLPSTPFVEISPDGTCRPPQAKYPESMGAVFYTICRDYRLVEILGKDQWVVLEYIGQE